MHIVADNSWDHSAFIFKAKQSTFLKLLKPADEVTTILPQAPHNLPGDITEGLNYR
jgi:dsDNA-binding SOS-regulon protein